MPIIASAKGDFTPAPEGTWQGVCVDVVDKGVEEYVFQGKTIRAHKVQLRWVLDAEPALPDGKPHMAVRKFTLSLGEKAALRPFLESWRGKAFKEVELEAFDLETLIGVNGQVQILHNHKKGNTYANVQAVLPLGRGMTKMEMPADYIRQYVRDAEANKTKNGNGAPHAEFPDDADWQPDETTPF